METARIWAAPVVDPMCVPIDPLLCDLDRLVEQLAQRVAKRGGIVGLAPADWKILAKVSDQSGLCLTQLAHAAGMRKGSVSRSLKALRYFDLVSWRRPEDGSKQYAATLTPKGLQASALARLKSAQSSPFNALSPEQRVELLALLELASSKPL